MVEPQSADLASNHLELQRDDDDVTIDIEKIISGSKHGRSLSSCSIYRVLPTIRDVNEDAYTPSVVSIGPFHYGKLKLKDMEMHKQILFTSFTQKAKTSLDNLISFVKHSLPEVRASYSEDIQLDEKELVKLVLVDAGFIIELFTSFREDERLPEHSKLLPPCLICDICLDLLLLENQLPFFVLEELFKVAFPHDRRSFRQLTLHIFNANIEQVLEPDPNVPNVRISHFTDLLRLSQLPKPKPPMVSWSGDTAFLCTATKLQEKGIKLKSRKSKLLLDLKFSGNVLKVPQISVDDRTEIVFRNMIALEQCHYPNEPYITNCALMLDGLINTDKDADLLIHNEIISNKIGDTKRVTLLFNNLLKNALIDRFDPDFLEICERLNTLCQDPCHKKKTTLRRDYFSTPWQTIASVAGIILLILTLVQTTFSVLQVAWKK